MKMEDLKILIVDDDDMFRQVTARIFSKICQVTTASGGNEAFELIQKNKFDIVFSDVCMPDGSGVELLEKVRTQHPEEPWMILLTGYSTLTIEETLSKGAKTIINKPFQKAALLEIANNYLSIKAGA